MWLLVNQRGAGKEKAAGKTGRLGGQQKLLLGKAGEEEGAGQMPSVMNSLCMSHVTALPC
jgi:hypothetical protein